MKKLCKAMNILRDSFLSIEKQSWYWRIKAKVGHFEVGVRVGVLLLGTAFCNAHSHWLKFPAKIISEYEGFPTDCPTVSPEVERTMAGTLLKH